MAVYSGSVYAAWKGEWSDPRLFFAKLGGSGFGPQAQIPNVYSDVGPALAAFGSELVAAWKSAFDQSIQYATYNGAKWSAPRTIPGVASSVGPSLASFNGKLYAAWKGENSDQGIYYASYDGTNWSAQTNIAGIASSVGPSLASFNGKLYAAWKGENSDQGIYYASYDGTNWSAQTNIAGVATSVGPALAEFNGKLYAMWKGENTDVSLWNAYFDGTKWSAQANNIPGNTGQDPDILVAAPSGGLGSNSNYIFYSSNKNLTSVTATIIVTEDIVSSNGFSFQLNCYCPSPKGDSCAWQQYTFAVVSNTLYAVVNNWPVDWDVSGKLVDLILEWIPLHSLGSNTLPAGYQLSMTLQNDSAGNITGFSATVVDASGATVANISKTLVSLGYSGFTSADEAPINGFELDLVGPDSSQNASLTSGQGIFHFAATNNLTALNVEPSGDLGIGTAETANSFYGSLPANYPNGDFWQIFTTSTEQPQVKGKAGKHMLKRPAAGAAGS